MYNSDVSETMMSQCRCECASFVQLLLQDFTESLKELVRSTDGSASHHTSVCFDSVT
jgi:hypothetical protein